MKNNKKINCPVCGGVDYKCISRYYGTIYPFNKRYNKLVRCNKCDLVYMNPMPSDSALIEFYSNYWNSETSVQNSNNESLTLYKAENKSRLSYLLQNIVSLEDKTILDFGAGHGFFNEALIEGKHNAKYYAVEADEKVVEQLKMKGVSAATKIEVFKQKEFDIIVAFHVLEHMTNPIEFLKSLIIYLKEGGLLFLEIPNQDYLFKKYFEPHTLFFNINSIKILMKKIHIDNFKVVSCGRKLQNIPKERTAQKLFRHKVGKVLNYMGLIKTKSKGEKNIDEEALRQRFEMDQFGENRQWLRIIIKK